MSVTGQILLAEDSLTQATHTRMYLQQYGFSVDVASNGRQALEMVRRSQPDVVVTDLGMPEMDGLELIGALRNEFERIPIVLMTARGSEEIASSALKLGAASYVRKTDIQTALVPTLERILKLMDANRANRKLGTLIAFSDIEYVLENDDSMVPHLIGRLQEDLRCLALCDDNELVQVATALDEALVNAIIHGNLEVSSELRAIDDAAPYQELIKQRKKQTPFSDRKVRVLVRASREEAVFVIRDEGPGFDPSAIPDPTDPANLEKVSGRGLLLINAFMDHVSYNSKGNELTMVKHKSAS